MSPTRLLLLSLVAALLIAAVQSPLVRAQDEDEDGVPRGEEGHGEVPQDPKVTSEDGESEEEAEALPDEEETEGATGLNVKTVFLGSAANEEFLAGQWVETLVSFANSDEATPYNVRFVAAHINAVGDPNAYIQNFTGNAYDRQVEGKETGTFKYRFKPHESLDPRDYNLVIRVFFTTNDNNTLAIAAFNGTITIQEPSGVDPETIMTFVTIFGLIGGAVWFFNKKKSKRSYQPRTSQSPTVEMGTAKGFDKNYVGDDHIRYVESLNRKSQSPKRK